MEPIRIAIIGTGGFAASHHAAVRALEEAGELRLIATCDPSATLLAAADEQWDLERRGVRQYADYRLMLEAHAGELDIVTVPTPIPLHAEMHRACVERGIACYLEKPPTLDFAELEAMLAVEAGARKETQVGFNFIVEDTRQSLKARIVAGEFGPVRRVGFIGIWPRATSYYRRNDWAGRLWKDGRLVLDSCIGNAMAHYVHNVHFWAGADATFSWATAASVQSELYRAHAIEGFDTCFLRALGENGVEMHIAATHACDGSAYQREWVICDQATLTYITNNQYEIRWNDGRHEVAATDRRNHLQENFRAYTAYIRGDAPRPMTRLIDSRPFVELNDLAYIAAKQITEGAQSGGVQHHSHPNGEFMVLSQIRETAEEFAASGRFPSEQGVAWARPGGEAARADLPRLPEAIRHLAEERQRLGEARE